MNIINEHKWWLISFVLAILLYAGYLFIIAPPSNFPQDKIIVIERGASISEISQELSDSRIISKAILFRFVMRASGRSSSVQAGTYRFNNPENLLVIAYRLVAGEYNIPPTRVTLVEGLTVREVANKIAEIMPAISSVDFINEAKQYEGYLFPDTYLFSPDSNVESVVTSMRANFSAKTSVILDKISVSEHSFSDVVIMASLLEKEARSTEVRRIVAGILWNRLKLGMPLQVDAVFGYIFNRDTYSPSLADLKIDSPYNTYLHTGLPPGPINNPGLDALLSAVTPVETNYLYYLTDKNGVMHYATTYSSHLSNQRKYLR